jgi:hypothetical protein
MTSSINFWDASSLLRWQRRNWSRPYCCFCPYLFIKHSLSDQTFVWQ